MKQFGKNVGGVVSGLTKVTAVAIVASAVGHLIGGIYAIASDAFEACGDELCPSRDAANVALVAGGFVCLLAAAYALLTSPPILSDAASQAAAKPVA